MGRKEEKKGNVGKRRKGMEGGQKGGEKKEGDGGRRGWGSVSHNTEEYMTPLYKNKSKTKL